ncbi:hypothetical protein [Nostoc sp. LPT]|uniref:hypothetical protein n=1 Tax=Nostoc sp. LPT TaxID=2815387 RepID=UPI001D5E3DB8|nr:hypothetical protein [Nostoc sp. LPT]MBN4006494.1 hypothetical protein [Nostoc sp. LPT]
MTTPETGNVVKEYKIFTVIAFALSVPECFACNDYSLPSVRLPIFLTFLAFLARQLLQVATAQRTASSWRFFTSVFF